MHRQNPSEHPPPLPPCNRYKDEQVTRKRLFNALEDIKGKIRVYCRVRPLLKFELDKGEKFALLIPNDVTIGHMWKDEKKPREYTFDQIFPPGAALWKQCGRGETKPKTLNSEALLLPGQRFRTWQALVPRRQLREHAQLM